MKSHPPRTPSPDVRRWGCTWGLPSSLTPAASDVDLPTTGMPAGLGAPGDPLSAWDQPAAKKLSPKKGVLYTRHQILIN